MTTWILLLLWTALVAWLGYHYADPALLIIDRAYQRVAALLRRRP